MGDSDDDPDDGRRVGGVASYQRRFFGPSKPSQYVDGVRCTGSLYFFSGDAQMAPLACTSAMVSLWVRDHMVEALELLRDSIVVREHRVGGTVLVGFTGRDFVLSVLKLFPLFVTITQAEMLGEELRRSGQIDRLLGDPSYPLRNRGTEIYQLSNIRYRRAPVVGDRAPPSSSSGGDHPPPGKNPYVFRRGGPDGDKGMYNKYIFARGRHSPSSAMVERDEDEAAKGQRTLALMFGSSAVGASSTMGNKPAHKTPAEPNKRYISPSWGRQSRSPIMDEQWVDKDSSGGGTLRRKKSAPRAQYGRYIYRQSSGPEKYHRKYIIRSDAASTDDDKANSFDPMVETTTDAETSEALDSSSNTGGGGGVSYSKYVFRNAPARDGGSGDAPTTTSSTPVSKEARASSGSFKDPSPRRRRNPHNKLRKSPRRNVPSTKKKSPRKVKSPRKNARKTSRPDPDRLSLVRSLILSTNEASQLKWTTSRGTFSLSIPSTGLNDSAPPDSADKTLTTGECCVSLMSDTWEGIVVKSMSANEAVNEHMKEVPFDRFRLVNSRGDQVSIPLGQNGDTTHRGGAGGGDEDSPSSATGSTRRKGSTKGRSKHRGAQRSPSSNGGGGGGGGGPPNRRDKSSGDDDIDDVEHEHVEEEDDEEEFVTPKRDKRTAFELFARAAMYTGRGQSTQAFFHCMVDYVPEDKDFSLIHFWCREYRTALKRHHSTVRVTKQSAPEKLLKFLETWVSMYPEDISSGEDRALLRDTLADDGGGSFSSSTLRKLERAMAAPAATTTRAHHHHGGGGGGGGGREREPLMRSGRRSSRKDGGIASPRPRHLMKRMASNEGNHRDHRGGEDGSEDYAIAVDVLRYSSKEIARELTRFEWDLFARISGRDLVGNATDSDVLQALAERFNAVCYWAATEVVASVRRRAQTRVLQHLIHVCEACIDIHNFSGAAAILSGLGLPAVENMSDACQALPMSSKKRWAELSKLFSTKGNYAQYNAVLDSSTPPLIPHVPCLIRQVMFTKGSYATHLPSGAVNLERALALHGSVIRRVETWQGAPYRLKPASDPSLVIFLRRMGHLKEDDLMRMSLAVNGGAKGDDCAKELKWVNNVRETSDFLCTRCVTGQRSQGTGSGTGSTGGEGSGESSARRRK